MKEHVYIAIDLKSFYASVECVDRGLDPLKARLVVADASRTDKTICLAVTPALKAYGLSGRSRLFEVIAKAKEVKMKTGKTLDYLIAPPRMARYMEVSSQIFGIYLKYVSKDDISIYSIDEAFIDISNYLRLYNMNAEELARMIINDVYKTTGITATAGIAPNLFLCKVAMDIVAKKIEPDENGVRIATLDVMSYRRKLWSYQPLTAFWRIGPATARKLNDHGIYTMGDIALTSIKNQALLYQLFGVDAEILIDHAWGIEPCTISHIKSYIPTSTSITEGQVLSNPYNKDKGRIIIKEIAENLALSLIEKKLTTDLITLDVGYDISNISEYEYDGEIKNDRYGRKLPKPAHGSYNLETHTDSSKKIINAVVAIYDKIVNPTLLIRRFNLSLGHTMPKDEVYTQTDLFSDVDKETRDKDANNAILQIQKKFGKNAIFKGSDLQEGATRLERNKTIGGHKG